MIVRRGKAVLSALVMASVALASLLAFDHAHGFPGAPSESATLVADGVVAGNSAECLACSLATSVSAAGLAPDCLAAYGPPGQAVLGPDTTPPGAPALFSSGSRAPPRQS